MKCEDVQALIPALIDNELAVEQRTSVEAHVSGCGMCASMMKDCRAIKIAADAWHVDTGDVADSVQRRIEREEQKLLFDEVRKLRAEIMSLRAEMTELRREIASRPVAAPISTNRRNFPYSDSQTPLPIV